MTDDGVEGDGGTDPRATSSGGAPSYTPDPSVYDAPSAQGGSGRRRRLGGFRLPFRGPGGSDRTAGGTDTSPDGSAFPLPEPATSSSSPDGETVPSASAAQPPETSGAPDAQSRPRPRPASPAAPSDEPDRPRPRPRPGPAAASGVDLAKPDQPKPDDSAPADSTGTDETATSRDESGDTATDQKADAATADGDKKDNKQDDGKKEDGKKEDGKEDDGDKPKRRRGGRSRKVLIRTGVIVVIVVVAAVLLRTYVVSPYYIPSGSMEPTLHGCMTCDDDHVLVDKISYKLHDPHIGDIVVFDATPKIRRFTNDSVLIKRIIALPGDHVVLRGGAVYVDGKKLKETYLDKKYLRKNCPPGVGAQTKPINGRSSWNVPKDDYFVMGDNRCESEDSRAFGPIPKSTIVGRAFMIVWPLGRIRFL